MRVITRHRLMLEHPEFSAASALMTALGVDRAVIGVEKQARRGAGAFGKMSAGLG